MYSRGAYCRGNNYFSGLRLYGNSLQLLSEFELCMTYYLFDSITDALEMQMSLQAQLSDGTALPPQELRARSRQNGRKQTHLVFKCKQKTSEKAFLRDLGG